MVCHLCQEDLDVEVAGSGEDGLDLFSSGTFDLVILDVLLPGINGFEVLRQIRSESNCAVIILTAKSSDIDRIIGLEVGADDYLDKSIFPRELVARLYAVLRRGTRFSNSTSGSSESLIQVGELVLDKERRSVASKGKLVELTTIEFNLLEALLQSVGRIVTREELSQTVFQRGFNPIDRSLDVHISQLRKKLEIPLVNGEPGIKTIRGVGYMFTRATTGILLGGSD
jgi:two-component system response regulator CpxR